MPRQRFVGFGFVRGEITDIHAAAWLPGRGENGGGYSDLIVDGRARDAEARLIARAVCAVVTVADPDLIVLGGGVGQAPGFAAAVAAELAKLSPAVPEVLVSTLGRDAVVDGCLVAGGELAWQRLTASLP